MASELLHCCICPKRPNFSDTSHLLTHVSSKGHLSHLHKLQVRSHQEISAVQQLNIYNQWYTQHNVAHLLSERMQQKEQKHARRKLENRNRQNASKRQPNVNVDPNLLPSINDLLSERPAYAWKSDQSYSRSSQVSEYTPTRTSRNVYPPPAPHEQLAQETPLSRPTDSSSGFTPHDNGMIGNATPDMAKLKGTIWPGMDMFDSADQETQRKRNQRKDGSVLERMQAMSELVEPFETVCSPRGTMKKQRHMDHLEDDSPVEGESPIIKHSTKRKRKQLGSLSAARPRKITHKTRRTATERTDTSTPTRKRASNANNRYQSRVNLDLLDANIGAPQVLNTTPVNQRKQPDFEIYDDQMFDLGIDYTTRLISTSFNNAKKSPDDVQPLVFAPATWLQPISQRDQIYDPFRDYRSARVVPYMHADVGIGKENENPLHWQKDFNDKAVTTSTPAPYDTFDNFDETFGALADVYAFTKNPLVGNTPRQVVADVTPCRPSVKKIGFDRKTLHYR